MRTSQTRSQTQGLRVGVPALVRDEYLRQYRDHVSELVTQYKNASKNLLAIPDWYLDREHPTPPSVEHLIQERAKSLQKRFGTFEECPGDLAKEALRREALRLPPAADGRGARDAGIWFTALAYAREHPEQDVYLVTKDGDFMRNGVMHPDLAAEAGQNLRLLRGEDDVLATFATAAKAPDRAQLGNDPRVRNAVEVAAYGMQLMHELGAFERMARGLNLHNAIERSSETLACELLSGHKPLAHQVKDQIWITLSSRWRLRREVYFVGQALATGTTDFYEVEFTVPITLIISWADNAVMSAHVVDRGLATLNMVSSPRREVLASPEYLPSE